MRKKRLTAEDILHLSSLSKLQLSKSEVRKFQTQLGETLDYMENLAEIKVDNLVEDLTKNTENNLREDSIEKDRLLNVADVFKNSKKKKSEYFAIKRIL